jgi:pilus assembly protein CpaB
MTTRDGSTFDDRFAADSIGPVRSAYAGDRARERLGPPRGARARSPGAARPVMPVRRSGGLLRWRLGRLRPSRGLPWWFVATSINGWPRRVLALMCLLAAAITAAHRPVSGALPSNHAGPTARVLVAVRDLAAGAALTSRSVRLVAVPADLVPAGAVVSLDAAGDRIIAAPVRRGEPITDARLLGPGLVAGLSPPDMRAVPVRLADAQTATLLRAGDQIDLYATPVDTAFGAAPAVPGDEVAGSGHASTGSAPPGEPSRGGPVQASGGSTSPGEAGLPGSTTRARAADPGRTTSVNGAPRSAEEAGATLLAGGVRILAVLPADSGGATDGVLVVVAATDRVARRLAAANAQERLSVAIRPP